MESQQSLDNSLVNVISAGKIKYLWKVVLVVTALILIVLTFADNFVLRDVVCSPFWLFIVIAGMAFFAEYIDSSLGMGYGTTLTPVLLIMGYSPLEIVPAILLSEFISGVTAGVLHHQAKNVDFRHNKQARNILIVMSFCSIAGTIGAVFFALSIPKFYVKLYIGVMILTIGIVITWGQRLFGTFSWKKITAIGVLAAFNKGISGGGYGPLITGGQVMSGVDGKVSISVTSLAEGLVCLVGLILYVVLKGNLYWSLALPLLLGAALSVPAAVITVKYLPGNELRKVIGYVTLFLGTLALLKLVF